VLAIVSDMKGNVLTRFVTPSGFHSTAAEVINGVNLASRRAIVTGGASGIGIETARALAGAGASVTLTVRRPDAAEPVAIELRRSTGNHAAGRSHQETARVMKFRTTGDVSPRR
jgi:pyruvate/2-oxoglutarate dehydrogenase complex dihydrolipoamide dehydrogenase (E3) component